MTKNNNTGSCCCCSLRSGTILIGIFDLVVPIMGAIFWTYLLAANRVDLLDSSGIDVPVLFVFFIGMIASLLSLSLTILLLTGAYYKRHTSVQSWLVIVGMILSIGSINYAVIGVLELLDTFAKGPDAVKAIYLLTPMLVLSFRWGLWSVVYSFSSQLALGKSSLKYTPSYKQHQPFNFL